MHPAHIAFLVLVVPLASAAAIALFLRRHGSAAAAVSVAAAGASACGALYLALHGDRFEIGKEWLSLPDLIVVFGFNFNDLAALMISIVAVVGFCVHVFSLGYMRDDPAKARYFAGLSVFMFSMIGIVLADNLFMMFVFWELVGFSSWLLINHWHERTGPTQAAKKAFIVNRVGDFGFLLGIAMCLWTRRTVNFTDLAVQSTAGAVFSRAIPLLLFCGAVGKSAQLPLQVWLPDAMEGPTPVSALIHAATMVAAGIYMLCRIEPVMVPQALTVITWVGTATALYAALCAITQNDIKKVLAYSTLSQLGYMVAAFGLGSTPAAMFHLTTHAFFKALLFLGSGSVILGCHHEQDILKMGGLAGRMRLTCVTFTIAVAAIIGLPGFAGFFSKDAILFLAYTNNRAVFVILAATAALTVFYMLRLWALVFLGKPRSEAAAHAHESGLSMTAPLVLLAVLSAIGGYRGIYPAAYAGVLGHVPEAEGGAKLAILATSLVVLAIGVALTWALYGRGSGAGEMASDRLAVVSPGLYGGLGWLRGAFDAAYGYYVEKIQQRFAMLLNFFDLIGLAGFIIRGTAGVVGLAGMAARAVHVGRINAYVYWFLGGVIVLWLFAAGVF